MHGYLYKLLQRMDAVGVPQDDPVRLKVRKVDDKVFGLWVDLALAARVAAAPTRTTSGMSVQRSDQLYFSTVPLDYATPPPRSPLRRKLWSISLAVALGALGVAMIFAERVYRRAPPPTPPPYTFGHYGVNRPAPDVVTSPFVPVFVDAKTERAIGPFPYDRAVLARAVERAADAGARGVVIKFFLDLPRSREGDEALARAMRRTKVLLQACINEDEAHPNPLPPRFTISLDPRGREGLLGGERGWLPLPLFADAAADLGFVDVRSTSHLPLAERYGDVTVKSLALCSLELATGQRAEMTLGRSVRLGQKVLTIDDRGEAQVTYPAADKLEYVSLLDLTSADAPLPRGLKGRVVILGYDGDGQREVDTPAGKLRLHRAFVYALESLYEQLR